MSFHCEVKQTSTPDWGLRWQDDFSSTIKAKLGHNYIDIIGVSEELQKPPKTQAFQCKYIFLATMACGHGLIADKI